MEITLKFREDHRRSLDRSIRTKQLPAYEIHRRIVSLAAQRTLPCSSEDRRGVLERLIALMQMLKFELVLLRHWR